MPRITNLVRVASSVQDGRDVDAFGRLRVSNPAGLFDAQFTYDLRPLQFEAVTATGGSGTATVAHDATNRCAVMTLTGAGNGASAYLQSFEYVRYQPGRSQQALVTFNFEGASTNVTKFAGLSDRSNGFEFQLSADGTKQLVLYSDTGTGDQLVAQSGWNLDRLDGTGPSGVTLDVTTIQILAIDFQALYAGRVRMGFDIDGQIIYAHEFDHANLVTTPYIQYASLPVRCGMTASGAATGTMRFLCCGVLSEGGQEENGGLPVSVEGTITAASGADTHILSIRPRTQFNSLTNRSKIVLDSLDIVVTGNSPVTWKLVAGQALTTPTYADVNTTYSAVSACAGAATLSGTPAIVLMQGYVPASATVKGTASRTIGSFVPITLSVAGAVRDLGTLTVVVQGVGGTSATRCVLNWRELR